MLTVYLGATYDANDRDRVVAGVSDGPAGAQANGEVFPDPNGGNIVMGTGNLFLNVTPGKLPTYLNEYPDPAKGYLSFSGTISGGTRVQDADGRRVDGGKLIKDGEGVQILAGDSVYIGGTDITEDIIRELKRTVR